MRPKQTQAETHTALFYETEEGSLVCTLCPHSCRIKPGKYGNCGVRTNEEGRLTSLNYAKVTAASVDPIEKKPLYHYYPGSSVFSIGTFGCNMHCPYCQNWQISQKMRHGETVTSDEIITMTREKKTSLLAYTYSEPVVWYEFVLECAKKAHIHNIKNIMVSNGFINPDPLEELGPFIDAWNIDLKTFKDDTYKKIQGASLKPILKTIETVAESSHLELTTLIVTGMNDSMNEMRSIVDWIASVDPSIPWHISRYFPSYNYKESASDESFILQVYDMAKEKLDHVYCGNMTGRKEVHNSYCPSCGNLTIDRIGYSTTVTGITGGLCSSCSRPFDGEI